MRVATWAIAERDGVLHDAGVRLPARLIASSPPAERMALLDVVHRAFVARLSNAAVHPTTVAELRTRYGDRALGAAADALAQSLRARLDGRSGDDEAPREAKDSIDVALRELVALFDPDGNRFEPVDDGPRPTLIIALRDFAKTAPSYADTHVARVILRARAATLPAARALDSHRAAIPTGAGIVVQPSAPDELLLAAEGEPGEAVHRLVRSAGTLASALGPLLPDVSVAIVVAHDDALAAVVAAGALAAQPGLVALDETAWEAATGLAAVPGELRCVDPAAAFGHDRWELSALLVRPPLFGRDDDIAALAAHLAPSSSTPAPGSADAPLLVALHGPAGIGKTSLLRAALKEAGYADAHAAVLWGAADAQQPTPWAAAVAMLRALADAPAGHPAAAERVRALIERLAGRLSAHDAVELKATLPAVLMLLGAGDDDVHDTPVAGFAAGWLSAGPASARSLRTSLRRALLLVTEALLRVPGADGKSAPSDRPAVFVVPGAEALDAPTRDALAFVAARLGRRARVVLLSQTRLRLPPTFEGVFRVERMEVRGLFAPAARELVAALLDSDEAHLAPDLGSLLEKARGSPLALVHGVRFAVEGGLLRRREDRWDVSGLEARDLPGRLDRLLRGRVERLPPPTRALLAGCAALGTVFLPGAAEVVGVRLGLAREEVGQALAFLVDTGFLARSNPRPGAPVFRDDEGASRDVGERPLTFEHHSLRAAAFATADAQQQRRLHAIAADALEATAPGGVDCLAAALARHRRLAGQTEQALERLAVAARRSALLDDRQGAFALAKDALALAGDDGKRALPFLLEIEALRVGGPRAAHREALQDLMRAAHQSDDASLRALALLRVASFDLSVGDIALAEDAAAKAVRELEQGGERHLRAAAPAHRVLASAKHRAGDVHGAASALARARQCAAEDRGALGAIEHQEGVMLLERGDIVAAVERLLAARAHRAAMRDVTGAAMCLEAIADAYARRGRLGTALALLEEALRLGDTIGDDAGRAQVMRRMASVLLAVGDVDAGWVAAVEARQLAREQGLDRLEQAAALLSARAQLGRGEVTAAEALLEGVRRKPRDPAASMEAALLSARARLLRAEQAVGFHRERALRSALGRAREAAALGEQHGSVACQVLGMALAGEALLLDGDPGAALTWTQRAVELLDDVTGEAIAVEDVLAPYVRVLEAVGDDEEALGMRARACRMLEEHAVRLPTAARDRFWSVPKRAFLRGVSPPPPASSASTLHDDATVDVRTALATERPGDDPRSPTRDVGGAS